MLLEWDHQKAWNCGVVPSSEIRFSPQRPQNVFFSSPWCKLCSLLEGSQLNSDHDGERCSGVPCLLLWFVKTLWQPLWYWHTKESMNIIFYYYCQLPFLKMFLACFFFVCFWSKFLGKPSFLYDGSQLPCICFTRPHSIAVRFSNYLQSLCWKLSFTMKFSGKWVKTGCLQPYLGFLRNVISFREVSRIFLCQWKAEVLSTFEILSNSSI